MCKEDIVDCTLPEVEHANSLTPKKRDMLILTDRLNTSKGTRHEMFTDKITCLKVKWHSKLW